jgi:hypothetical protein
MVCPRQKDFLKRFKPNPSEYIIFFKEFLLVKRNGLPMIPEMLRENMIVGKVPRIQNITAVKLIF